MEKYSRGKLIGEGTFGKVFEAIRQADGLKVAIKRLRSTDPNGGVDRTVLREIQYLQDLNEENIVTLYDVYIIDDNVHLVMEYCPYDLEKLIRDKNILFHTSHVKCIMIMLLRGIQQCHKHYILHRDLKPGNILFDMNGQLKLTDFGLARSYGSPIPMSCEIVTRWYRAPELFYGCKFYNESVDIWAIGCIFSEIILRTPMFQGASDFDQLGKIFNILGTPTDINWPDVRSLPNYVEYEPRQPMDLRPLFPHHHVSKHHSSDSSGSSSSSSSSSSSVLTAVDSSISPTLDLLLKLLKLNPNHRLQTSQALIHPYFKMEPLACHHTDLPRPH